MGDLGVDILGGPTAVSKYYVLPREESHPRVGKEQV